jgi:predicted DCC family thiol-disulfide oxidoreductase YuxK
MKARANIVLYDDTCSMCCFQMRLLAWLDWFGVATLLPISDARASEMLPRVTRADLMEAIHCVTPQDRVYRGARCIRHLGMRIPLLTPLSLALWIPGVIWIADRAYGWVSRNRQPLSRLFGCKGACAVVPAHRRSSESERDEVKEAD